MKKHNVLKALASGVALGVFALSPLVGAAQAQVNPAENSENWRQVDPENLFILDTTKGRIVIEAFPWSAPNHVVQFRTIIRSGDYDGTVFHRVIDDFMAQGGDIMRTKGRPSGLPNVDGEFTFERDPFELEAQVIGEPDSGRYGYIDGAPINTQSAFLAEMNESGTVESYIMHCPGVVSTARTDDPNSANSQFFLMRQTAPHLDQNYTAWGRVIVGLDVVRAIKAGTREGGGSVTNPDVLVSARVAADLEGDQAITAWVQKTDGPEFLAYLETVDGRANVCDLEPVAAIVE